MQFWNETKACLLPSIRLIIVVPMDCVSEFHLHRLLDNIFQSMVLLVGLDDLIALRHIDRVKRELRASYSLVDCLLNGLQPNERTTFFGDLIGAPDILVCQVLVLCRTRTLFCTIVGFSSSGVRLHHDPPGELHRECGLYLRLCVGGRQDSDGHSQLVEPAPGRAVPALAVRLHRDQMLPIGHTSLSAGWCPSSLNLSL